MKNLDPNSETTNFSLDASQRITIKFTGGNHAISRQCRDTHTVTVPYSSFSQRMQAIQRSGGKITHVSISRFQLDLVNQNVEETNLAIKEVAEPIAETVVAQQTPEDISKPDIQQVVKPSLEISSQDNSENTLGIVIQDTVEIDSVQEPEAKVEIISAVPPQEILAPSELATESVTLPTTKNKKQLTEPAVKPKKAKTSTKTSHGFSKKESSHQVQEHVAIAETVTVPEPIVEIIPEPVAETVTAPEPIVEIIPEPVVEAVIEVIPENPTPVAETTVKSKKSKNSTKTSHGFSKKEASPQVQEPVAIAETVTVPEPIVEIIPEPVAETVTAPEPIAEIIPEPVVEAVIEVISETPTPVAETTVKSKKSKNSTKTSHGFSKKEASPQVQESVAIAETVTAPEPVVEIVPEPISTQILEPVAETSTEAVPEHVTESVAPLPISKSKKSKASSKSGSGFNKPKSTTNQAPSSSQKPKI